MTRQQKDPLRRISEPQRQMLEQLSRAQPEPAVHVLRAQVILAVANGANYTNAAHSIGRRSGDAVSHLVTRFNQEGLAALEPRHGGGRQIVYDGEKRKLILQTASTPPEPEQDGTLSWSLSTLQRHLRKQAGFSSISTYTLWRVLHEADWRWQESRRWCDTGRSNAVVKAAWWTSQTQIVKQKRVD